MRQQTNPRYAYALLLLGMASFWPNLQHSFFRMTFTGRLGASSCELYALSLTVIAIVTAVYALAGARIPQRRQAPIEIPLAGGAATLAAVCLTVVSTTVGTTGETLDHTAWCVSALFTAIWSAAIIYLLFRWVVALETLMFSLDVRLVVGIVGIGAVVGFLLIPVMAFDSWYYRCVACLCPLLSSTALAGLTRPVKQDGSTGPASPRDEGALGPMDPPEPGTGGTTAGTGGGTGHWAVLAGAYIVASLLHAAFFALDSAIDLTMYSASCYVVVTAFGVALALACLPDRDGRQIPRLWVGIAAGLFSGILFAMVFLYYGDRSSQLNAMSASIRCLQILFFIVLLLMVYQRRRPAVTVFARWFVPVEILSNVVCYYAAAPLVQAMGSGLKAWIDPLAFAVGILLAAALLVSLAVFMASDSMRTISFVRRQSGPDEPKPLDPREARCAKLAAETGLTQREQDVLYYLSMGHNAKKVAETLFVSYETVRTHTTNLYRKLGVHSKQELIDLVDSGKRD